MYSIPVASLGPCIFLSLFYTCVSFLSVLHSKGKKHYRYYAEHVMSWSRQIALALKYIHDKAMLHRDVKPSKCVK